MVSPWLLLVALTAATNVAEPQVRTMELDAALELLERQNPDLAQIRSRAEEAAATSRLARAAVLPKVQLGGSYIYNNEEAVLSMADLFGNLEAAINRNLPQPISLSGAGLPEDVVIQPKDQFVASGGLRVPIFSGAAHWDWRAANLGADAAHAATAAARATLRATLVKAAWSASAAEGLVRIAAHSVESARAHYHSTARAVAVGVETQVAELRAQTELVHREASLAQARATLDEARLRIGILLGFPEHVRIPMPEVPPIDRGAASVEVALANRPEITAARARVEAAQARRTGARVRWAPTLSASGLGFASTDEYPTGERSGWRATVDLTWNLYDGGAREAARDLADAGAETVEAALRSEELRVAREVEDAARELRVAEEQLRLASQRRALAVRAAEVTERAYSNGQVGAIEVVDALSRSFEAEVGEAQARARLGMANVGLQSALGRL